MNNCYEYLEIILKYFKKNEGLLNHGLDYYVGDDETNPLLVTLKRPWCTDDKLDLLLFQVLDVFASQSDSTDSNKVVFSSRTLNVAYKQCKENIKNDKWARMIQQYAKRTGQEIVEME